MGRILTKFLNAAFQWGKTHSCVVFISLLVLLKVVLEEEEEEEIFDEINELPQVYTSYLDVSVKVSIPFGNKKLPRQTSLIFVGLK